MNRERCKELLPVFTAFANGEDVQLRLSDEWRTMNNMTFDRTPEDYRIKPKPREWYLNPESKYPDTYTITDFGNPGAGWIKVVEVL